MSRNQRTGSLVLWLAVKGVLSHRGESAMRLAVSVIAVVVMLVGFALTPTALARSARSAESVAPELPRVSKHHGVLVQQSNDYFESTPIRVRSVAVENASAEDLRSLPVIPRDHELVASKSMAKLMAKSPELSRRYPGTIVGNVPDRDLIGPRELVVWQGIPRSELSPDAGWLAPDRSGSRSVADIADNVPSEIGYGIPIIVAGFLLPLLALVALLTTLGGSRRERRLASLRLLGLTDRQAKITAALEDGVLSAVSLIAGGAVWLSLVPALAPHLPFDSGIWPSDISLYPLTVVALVLAFPVASVAASWLSLRALSTSPLGVERRSIVKEPRWWRVIPLAAGLVLLGIVLAGIVTDVAIRAPMVLAAGVLLMTGIAGSLAFAVKGAANRLASRSRSLPILVAARRIQATPSAATRVAVGLTLMVTMCGPLLVFFPLIADVGAPDLKRLETQLGQHTLVSTQSEATDIAKQSRQRAATVAAFQRSTTVRDGMVFRHVRLMSSTGSEQELVAMAVDCRQLAQFTDIPVRSCENGLVVSSDEQSDLDGKFFAYREVQDDESGLIRRQRVGTPVDLHLQPGTSPQWKSLAAGLEIHGVLMSDELLNGKVPMDGFARTLVASADKPLYSEKLRTAMMRVTRNEALSVHEQYAIASRTTRSFSIIAMIASVLIVSVAGFATVITAYEQVRESVHEMRLMAISGAPDSLFARVLLLQSVLPTALGVMSAAAASTALSLGFVRLLDYTTIPVPVAGIATVSVVALLSTAVATGAVAWAIPRSSTTPFAED